MSWRDLEERCQKKGTTNKLHIIEGVGRISALIPTYIDLHDIRVPCSVHNTGAVLELPGPAKGRKNKRDQTWSD